MLLPELLKDLAILASSDQLDVEIDNIVYDSRKARQGSLFVAIDGFITDGHKYIEQAVDEGVAAILLEKTWDRLSAAQQTALAKIAWVQIENTRQGLAQVSSSFFQHPADKLDLVGITGTKGKTTTTFMVKDIFTAAGRQTGLIGTVSNMIGDKVIYATRTTPESYDLQSLLDEMVEAKLDSCIMEVSSQGLKLDRIYGCHFKVAAFTNLYEDHIGPHEHADMDDYLQSKLQLFTLSEQIVINRDIELYRQITASGLKHISYGLHEQADVKAVELEKKVVAGRVGTEFRLISPWYNEKIFVGMPGIFNVSNALAAIAICASQAIPIAAVKAGLADVSVPGRVQSIANQQGFQVIIDYAHNAASLETLLHTLRDYTSRRLIVVFGNGGDRARTRRFEMGKIAGKLADLTIITSDNPRTEDPQAIIHDIITGIKPTGGQYQIEADREKAIELAIRQAKKGDTVVIAGKGHENYQIFKDRTIHFDDAEVAAGILAGGRADE